MIWMIALGSALGGVSRYLLGGYVQRWAGSSFPLATLLINITGSFLLGFLYRYGADSTVMSPDVRAMLTIGFCGGFTTFSTFSYETVRLVENGEFMRALTYIGLSVLLSVAAAMLGIAAGQGFTHLRRG